MVDVSVLVQALQTAESFLEVRAFRFEAFSPQGRVLGLSYEAGYVFRTHLDNIVRSEKRRELANEAVFNRQDTHVIDEPAQRNLGAV